jgi:hypothetical protein
MCGGFCGVPRFPTTSALLVEQLVAVSKDGTKIPREHCQMDVAYETLRHFVQDAKDRSRLRGHKIIRQKVPYKRRPFHE